MPQLLGQYECAVDAKGRIRLPSQLIKQLGESENYAFVMNKGFEQHLVLYPQSTWDKTTAEFDQLNPYDADTRQFLRRFYHGVAQIEMDGQERILIPKRLAEYAGIDKDATITAMGERIEIWATEVYEQMMDSPETDAAEIAQRVLGGIK